MFVIALDEKYGQGLWNDFPEIANKGKINQYQYQYQC